MPQKFVGSNDITFRILDGYSSFDSIYPSISSLKSQYLLILAMPRVIRKSVYLGNPLHVACRFGAAVGIIAIRYLSLTEAT